MCTLTWWLRSEGYALWFNRDELNTRAPETAPEILASAGGAEWQILPRDGTSGGTWISTNAAGLTVALLNDYTATWCPSTPVCSRGVLVETLGRCENAAEISARLDAMSLAPFGAFRLVAVAADATSRTWSWDGVTLQCSEPTDHFYSSSSFRPAEVIAARRTRFSELQDEGEAIRFHRQHDPGQGASSVLMVRSDARTRSICGIEVSPEGTRFRYWPVESAAAVGEVQVIEQARR